VEGHPGVSGTVLFPREKFRGTAGWILSLAWLRTLRDGTPDLAIDLQGLLRSALFARVSGAPRIVGLADAREGARLLLGEKASVRPNDHAVNRYLAVLDLIGIPQPSHPEFLLPEGKLPMEFERGAPYVVLHPFARGEGKSLGVPLIRAFARGVAPGRLVVVGRGSLPQDLPPNVEDWTNRTDLPELTAILRGASFIVSSDSGPMHLAAALQPSRTLAVHLWSDPLKVGPCFPESLVWKYGRVARVSELDDSYRAEGRAPSEEEKEALGRMAAKEMQKEE